MKSLLKLSLGNLIFFCIASCATGSTMTVEKIEKNLNSLIGEPAPGYTNMQAYWKVINETDIQKEIEFSRPDGCSYAILVSKKTNLIESWRFTSERSQCEHEIYAPSI